MKKYLIQAFCRHQTEVMLGCEEGIVYDKLSVSFQGG